MSVPGVIRAGGGFCFALLFWKVNFFGSLRYLLRHIIKDPTKRLRNSIPQRIYQYPASGGKRLREFFTP